MRVTRFQIAKRDIESFFDNLDRKTFKYTDISEILAENREGWRLTVNLTARSFIDLLLKSTKLKKHEFDFPQTRLVRYSWGEIPVLQVISSLSTNSYFTHYTALYLHDLTDQVPKTIYLNAEQSRKPVNSRISSQDSIDRAFSRPQRISKNIAVLGDHRVCLLSGKFTNGLGVSEIETSRDGGLLATGIERTLIDVAVRPAYSGGVHEILSAYKRAEDRVSINRLTAILKKLDYTYPYHQAIGFYLDRSGVYRESRVRLLQKFDIEFDFYLTSEMKDTEYSAKWKLYYPKGF